MDCILDFKLICRICLTEKDKYKNLYDTDIANMMNECGFIKVSVNDGFPKNICIHCEELITLSYNFKQQCVKSEIILKKYFVQLQNENNETGSCIVKKVYNVENHITDDNVSETFTPNQSFKDNFVCSHCNKEFNTANALKAHVRYEIKQNLCDDNSSSDKGFVEEKKLLSNTNRQIDGDENLTAFLEESSPPPLPYQCSECTHSFSAEYDLKLHMSTHIKSGDYVCLKCNKKFATRQMLKRHIKTHMLHKPHVCKECGKDFAESHALTKHMRCHTGLPREKKHQCTVCKQGFSEPFYLNVHMRKHTGERPLMCSSCGKSFADPRSLKTHKMIHTGERPYKCHTCNKSFTQSVNLTKHVRIHTGEKPYICIKCGKCFTQSSSLDKHTRTHTGERPYSCEHCPKRFAEKGTLIYHQRIHTGEKPYVCAVCGKSYASNSELRLHDRKHSGIKKNVCNICGRDFATPSNLIVHLRKHSGERPFVCYNCARSFADKGSLRKHLKSHIDKPFLISEIHTIDDKRMTELITDQEQTSTLENEEMYYNVA